jgi:hypothetical protein
MSWGTIGAHAALVAYAAQAGKAMREELTTLPDRGEGAARLVTLQAAYEVAAHTVRAAAEWATPWVSDAPPVMRDRWGDVWVKIDGMAYEVFGAVPAVGAVGWVSVLTDHGPVQRPVRYDAVTGWGWVTA